MTSEPRRFTWLAAAALLAGAAVVAAGQEAVEAPRLVAIGDVHGDLDHLVAALSNAGMIDGQRAWVGGDAVLVQVGDFLDRGREVRQVMDLMMRLQNEAAAAGGRFVVVLGNHEVMNILGIDRDVNPEAYLVFADGQSERRQRDGWQAMERFRRRRRFDLGQRSAGEAPEDEAAWRGAYPLGRLEYIEAMGPDGAYGRWLRTLPAAVRVGRTLLLHGGISPANLDLTEDDLNRRIAGEIATYDEIKATMIADGNAQPTASLQDLVYQALNELKLYEARVARRGRLTAFEAARARQLEKLLHCSDWFLLNPDGPLWYRGMAVWTEDEHAQLVDTILSTLGLDRIVLGHTERYDGTIHTRFEGRIVFVDSGLPAALEIRDGRRLEAVYPDGRVVLEGPSIGPVTQAAVAGREK